MARRSNLDLTVPSTGSSPGSPSTLPERINASSRSIHTQLNRLIIARLPLALPPCTTDPSSYISGLLHIAPIYITFESLWDCILQEPQFSPTFGDALPFNPQNYKSPLIDSSYTQTIPSRNIAVSGQQPKICERTYSLLKLLRLPGLRRSRRLRDDLLALLGTIQGSLDEQLKEISEIGKVAEFVIHVQQSVWAKPHVLVAYAWVLYMALFSGGRVIRETLQIVDSCFWTTRKSLVHPAVQSHSNEKRFSQTSVPQQAHTPGPSHQSSIKSLEGSGVFQFFSFEGNDDGEDMKQEFKARVAEAEEFLTDAEKEDIIQESQEIFKFMMGLVAQLDAICAGTIDDGAAFPSKRDRSLLQSMDEDHVRKKRGFDEERRESLLEVLVSEFPAITVHFRELWSKTVAHTRDERVITKDLRLFLPVGILIALVAFCYSQQSYWRPRQQT